MSSKHLIVTALLAVLSVGTTWRAKASDSDAQARACDSQRPTIVLVHGAFTDASSFVNLIPFLQDAGYEVSAVQLPLTSLSDDIAATQRVLAMQDKDVVLVGHSYGGVVISAAGLDPKVKALVYIAAFAPDAGEGTSELNAKFPPSDLGSALIPDDAGFLSIDRTKYHAVFAADLPESQTRVLAVVQKPTAQVALAGTIQQAAWHALPSWYLVAAKDHAINPDLERFMAQRIGATTIELDTSHVPFVSRPADVSRLILRAASAVQTSGK